jgi:hypothetical protein
MHSRYERHLEQRQRERARSRVESRCVALHDHFHIHVRIPILRISTVVYVQYLRVNLNILLGTKHVSLALARLHASVQHSFELINGLLL